MWSEGQKSEQATGAQGTDELISSIARQTERLVMSGVASGDNQKDIARQIADAIKDEGKIQDKTPCPNTIKLGFFRCSVVRSEYFQQSAKCNCLQEYWII